MSSTDRISVLFVCLGNICRSPLAEGVLRSLADEAGVGDQLQIDSAGTGAYHEGEAPDARSVATAAANGIRLTGIARQVQPRDLETFDWVVAMDRSNLRSLQRLGSGEGSGRIVLLRDYDPVEPGGDVPDPYYGGADGFNDVFEIVDRSCRHFLEEIAPA